MWRRIFNHLREKYAHKLKALLVEALSILMIAVASFIAFLSIPVLNVIIGIALVIALIFGPVGFLVGFLIWYSLWLSIYIYCVRKQLVRRIEWLI